MKTRIFTLIVSLFITAMAFAYDVKIDGIYYELVPSENAAHVTCDYDLEDAERGSYSGAVIIPESFTHQGTSYKVVSIMSKSFEYSILLTSIKIPNSITSIGNRAFKSCISLKSIELPNSVTSIGDNAFNGCASLTSIELPNSVTSIRSNAFEGCSSLTSINIPEGVTEIGYCAFSYCSALTSIELPNSVTTIESYAFLDCSALTSIELPNSVTTIESCAFFGCSSLKSIELPNSVTTIGYSAFMHCSALTSINIPEKITKIESNTFYDCSSLTSITIPDSVTTIEDRAFSNCTSLTSITIPESVTSMESNVFECCGSLETIIILCEVPPTIDPNNKTFEDCYYANINANIKVPCGSIDIYKLLYPKQSEQIIENFPLLTTTSNNDNYGHITIIKQNSCDDNIAQIKAEANKGYHFEKWSDGNTENPRTITVTEDMSLIAEFIANQYQIILESNGNGSVTGSGTYDYGTKITIEAIENKGYHFKKWSDGNTENPRTITVTEDMSLIAEFIANQYQVTLKSNGNGSVTGSGTYDYGTEVTIEAIADKGYHFEKWSDGNTENPRTITVTKYINLTAEFAIDQYQVTLKSNGNGSVTGSGTYDYGTEITIEAIANKGYHFEKWSDGNTENPRKITVTEDMTLTAEFAIDQYQVTLKSNGNGSVTGSGTYDYGTKVTIEAIADKGYHFVKWSDGNTENPRTITVTEDIELSATFELDETPVENVQITSANVYSSNGRLHVEGAETDYYVLDMAGRLIYSGRDTELQLPRGVYVVNVGGEVQKVVL